MTWWVDGLTKLWTFNIWSCKKCQEIIYERKHSTLLSTISVDKHLKLFVPCWAIIPTLERKNNQAIKGCFIKSNPGCDDVNLWQK